MRIWIAGIIACLLLALGACTRQDDEKARREGDAAAYKAGQAAYNAAQETKKAARKAGQELRKAGRNAQAGWDEARRESEAKKKQQ